MTARSFAFAQSATHIEDAARQLHAYMHAQKNDHWAALMDSSFDHGQSGAFASIYRNVSTNCYAFPDLQGLAATSPRLFQLPAPETPELLTSLRSLLHHCSGRPMLSFVALKDDAQATAQHWHPLHWVFHDEQKLLLRFADTRTLAALPALLTPLQWADWSSPVNAWGYIDRSGALTFLTLSEQEDAGFHSHPQKMELSDAQLSAFIECSLPDAALQFLQESLPDIIPSDMDGYAFYDLATQSLGLAKQHSISSWGDQIALIAAACLSAGQLLQAPQLPSLLAKQAWKPGELGLFLAGQPALQPHLYAPSAENLS